MAPESPDPEIRTAQSRAVAEADADPATADVMPGQTFVAHHSMPPEEAAESMRRAAEQGRTFHL